MQRREIGAVTPYHRGDHVATYPNAIRTLGMYYERWAAANSDTRR